jgi:hypothetical protein
VETDKDSGASQKMQIMGLPELLELVEIVCESSAFSEGVI